MKNVLAYVKKSLVPGQKIWKNSHMLQYKVKQEIFFFRMVTSNIF